VLRKKGRDRNNGTLEHWKDGIMGFCFPNIPLTNIPIFQLEHDAP